MGQGAGRTSSVAADRSAQPDPKPVAQATCTIATRFRNRFRVMRALRFERKIVKYGAARVASIRKAGRGAVYGPLSLDDDAKHLP